MRKLLGNIWVAIGLAVLAGVAFFLLANIGPIIGALILLALIPVIIEVVFAVAAACFFVAAWVFITVWEWISPPAKD